MKSDKQNLFLLEKKLKTKLSHRVVFTKSTRVHPKHSQRKSNYHFNSTSEDKIISLDLSGQNLEEIPKIVLSFKSLEKLNISNNKITSISSIIGKFKMLEELAFDHNQIRQIPKELFHIGSLRKITGQDNPIFSPPVEILSRGKNAVIAYFESLDRGQITLNECKVIILGDGGAGKTSLLRRLKGEEFNPKEKQTHGINIEEYFFEKVNESVKVNYWDFGGQEIMHSTHQFFFTKRSLYLLVLDSRKEDKTEYWLKLIKTLARNSPVIVVLNKIDENPSFDVNRKFLKEKYPNILGFYRVSCFDSTGLDELRSYISSSLTEVELLNTKWPANWLTVKMHLENVQDDYLSLSEFRKICSQFDISLTTSQNTLVDYLHDLGVVVHFQDPSLSNTHVLEPHWLTTAVYKIINSKWVAEQNGLLKFDQLDGIINESPKGTDSRSPSPSELGQDAGQDIQKQKVSYYIDLIFNLANTSPQYQELLMIKLREFIESKNNEKVPDEKVLDEKVLDESFDKDLSGYEKGHLLETLRRIQAEYASFRKMQKGPYVRMTSRAVPPPVPKYVSIHVPPIIRSDLEMLFGRQVKPKNKTFYYPPEKFNYIIEVMKKFELCFTVSSNKILIPDLLEIQEPDIDFDLADSLRFVLDYEFIPKSIMPRLIVRLHNEINEENEVHIWRTGMYITDVEQETNALIRSDEEERQIRLFMSGKKASGYLYDIRKILNSINSSFQGIVVNEKIACNCRECVTDKSPFYFKYEFLVKLSNKGGSSIFCEKSLLEINIKNLLEGVKHDPVQEIRKKIGKGELEAAINLAEKYISLSSKDQITSDNFEEKDSILLLKNRLKNLDQLRLKGTEGQAQLQISLAKLTDDFLSLLRRINF